MTGMSDVFCPIPIAESSLTSTLSSMEGRTSPGLIGNKIINKTTAITIPIKEKPLIFNYVRNTLLNHILFHKQIQF